MEDQYIIVWMCGSGTGLGCCPQLGSQIRCPSNFFHPSLYWILRLPACTHFSHHLPFNAPPLVHSSKHLFEGTSPGTFRVGFSISRYREPTLRGLQEPPCGNSNLQLFPSRKGLLETYRTQQGKRSSSIIPPRLLPITLLGICYASPSPRYEWQPPSDQPAGTQTPTRTKMPPLLQAVSVLGWAADPSRA